MSKVLVDSEIWDIIKSHYKEINDSGTATVNDRRVISFILDKELAAFKRATYLDDKDRLSRLDKLT